MQRTQRERKSGICSRAHGWAAEGGGPCAYRGGFNLLLELVGRSLQFSVRSPSVFVGLKGRRAWRGIRPSRKLATEPAAAMSPMSPHLPRNLLHHELQPPRGIVVLLVAVDLDLSEVVLPGKRG